MDELAKIRDLVRCGDGVVSSHVEEDIADDAFSLDDIRACVAAGSVRKVEEDEKYEANRAAKYTIEGVETHGLAFEVVGKIVAWVNGDAFYVVTAYPRIQGGS